MDESKIKDLKLWIIEANKTINQDINQFCTDNEIDYTDYYPYMTGYLKTIMKHLNKILEGD